MTTATPLRSGEHTRDGHIRRGNTTTPARPQPVIVLREGQRRSGKSTPRPASSQARLPRAQARPVPSAHGTARTNSRSKAAAQPTVRTRIRKRAPAPTPKPALRSRMAAPLGFTLAASAIGAGWHYRSILPLSAEQGLGYALGFASVTCVLTLLIYPLRKRIRLLRFLGPINIWFRTHQQMGVLATLTALYHCSFQVGSLNSQLALTSLLLVAGSGLIGRFLYRKINRSLYGKKTDLKAIRAALADDGFPNNQALKFLPLLKGRIHRFDESVLSAGTGLWSSIGTALTLASKARRERRILSHFSRAQLDKEAQRSPLVAQHRKRMHWAIDRYLFTHMARLRLLARIQAYERLFALWHVVHLPFFVLLVLSVALHIFAVHRY